MFLLTCFRVLVVFHLCVSAVIAEENYDISEKIIFPDLPNAAPRSGNTICREESQTYIENLNNFTLWAHSMWDSTAKSTTGVLQGSNFNFGNFEECINIRGPFRTQYCLATMTAHIPDAFNRSDPFTLTFDPFDILLRKLYKTSDDSQQFRNLVQLGWCVPSSCTARDLEKSLNQYLSKVQHPFLDHNVTYSGIVEEKNCQSIKTRRIFDSLDVSFCILAFILILLVLIGTVYEIRTFSSETLDKSVVKGCFWRKCLMAFSARKCYHEIQRAEESNPSLRVLYGLRTFSILMIVTDHRFGTYLSGPLDNFDYIEQEYRSSKSWYLFHGDLFVDTFFILSGILVVYGLLCQYDKRVVNPGFIILLRYLRLTPLYAFVIFFWSTLFAHTGSGPFWQFVVPKEVADCRKNWWSNLLYISNYYGGSEMCMIQSWYLPCDLHYFIIAIFVVLLMHKNRKLGFLVLCFLYLLSVVAPFVITVAYLRPALMYFYPKFLVDPKGDYDFHLTYIKSHTRSSPYVVGMFAGYIYYKLKDKQVLMSKWKSHILTLVSFFLLILGMASGAVFYNPYHKYNAIEAGFYASLHRTVWSLGTIGIIFSASFGHAYVLKNALSWSPWIPLGKLVYGVYLIHMMFQLRSVGMTTTSRHFNYFNTFSYAVSDIVWSFMLSFLLYIAIENPSRKIIKMIFTPQKNSAKEEVPIHKEDIQATSRL